MLAFGIAMAAVLGVMAVFVYLRVGGELLASVDLTLRSQSQEAVADLKRGEGRLSDRDVAGGTTFAQLLRSNGSIARTSNASLRPLLSATQIAALPLGGSAHRSLSLRRPSGEWRLLAVHPQGVNGVIVVARSLEPRAESLRRLLRELLIAAPLALILALGAGYWLASAALRPVEAMRRRAAGVTGDSPTRLPVPPSGDEISRLAETLNEMLDRLHESIEHERRFVADASHELRTPLALLRTELDLALRRPRSRDELESALRSAAEEAERLTRLAEDLLLIARGDRGGLPLRPAETAVADAFETVAARFATQAEALNAVLRVDDAAHVLVADRGRLEQALSNLVDNALTYGACNVDLFARPAGGRLELHVADDGPGFPPEFVERAFDRFSRADHARGNGGTGLGLAIVAVIAEAHGGEARIANRPGGGADVWIAVPAEVRQPALI